MADASDIYRRFVDAPLRLKAHSRSPSPPSTPPSPIANPNVGVWDYSPSFSKRTTEIKLRRHVARVKLSAADALIPRDLDGERQVVAALDSKSEHGTSWMDSKVAQNQLQTRDTATTTLSKKKKRVTGSVGVTNEEPGANFVDTPTKLLKPPKRFRKHSQDLCSTKKDEKASCSTTPLSFEGATSRLGQDKDSVGTILNHVAHTRNVSATTRVAVCRSRHMTIVSPELAAATILLQHTKEASKKTAMDDKKVSGEKIEPIAATPQQDLILTYCETLLSTSTISGCFFALAWNGLRDVHYSVRLSLLLASISNPYENVLTICYGIAECERLAQQSFPLKSPTKPIGSKPHGGLTRRRPCEKIRLKAKKAKKSVQFRSFDLSCLNLEYAEDEQVAVMVDTILSHYGTIMEQLRAIVLHFDSKTDSPEQAVIREFSCVMASSSQIYSSSQRSSEASRRIFQRAFGGRDSSSQHEIKICGEYFARQFANLLLPRTLMAYCPRFLQRVFSPLISSSVRFKLRYLFLNSEDFGEDAEGSKVLKQRVLRDEDGQPFPAMALYEHQDLGAAIHWALQESVLYWSLVQPLVELLKGGKVEYEENSGVKAFLDKSAAEDLDHMEKYILARRFLRFHLTKSWRLTSKGESAIAETWASIEKVCSLAKRFNFEDEAHLFPLASMDEFVTMLACEEVILQRMEEVLQLYYSQEDGSSPLQSESCTECHHVIIRRENPSSIRCTSCARRFHLGCLHLPESFAQYAEHYTCPACFLGRGGNLT